LRGSFAIFCTIHSFERCNDFATIILRSVALIMLLIIFALPLFKVLEMLGYFLLLGIFALRKCRCGLVGRSNKCLT